MLLKHFKSRKLRFLNFCYVCSFRSYVNLSLFFHQKNWDTKYTSNLYNSLVVNWLSTILQFSTYFKVFEGFNKHVFWQRRSKSVTLKYQKYIGWITLMHHMQPFSLNLPMYIRYENRSQEQLLLRAKLS